MEIKIVDVRVIKRILKQYAIALLSTNVDVVISLQSPKTDIIPGVYNANNYERNLINEIHKSIEKENHNKDLVVVMSQCLQVLNDEEYRAIQSIYLEANSQVKTAQLLNVSRSTLNRLLNKAYIKIGEILSLVNSEVMLETKLSISQINKIKAISKLNDSLSYEEYQLILSTIKLDSKTLQLLTTVDAYQIYKKKGEV